ncbi:hypothetical protein Dimus_031258 [Dionaea muscipula]
MPSQLCFLMDSWNYLSDGKNLFLSEELDLTVDGLGRSRSKVVEMGWEMKFFPHTDSSPFISNTEALESLELMGLGGFSKPYSSEQSGDGFSNEVGANSYENLAASLTANSNVVCGENDSGLGASTSSYFMESSSEGSPPIDLKLGCLPESKGSKDGELPEASKDVTTSVVLSSPTKRARSRSLHSSTPFCQVYGCNKDLSSSKGYHKRHKVCDVHSKTAKVIVNDIEQRFCQQCSRFHLLSEFDDGKRSCRKRLANHNRRRRKPQIAAHSGTEFLDPSLVKRASFLFPDILPSAILSPSKHEPGNWMHNYIKFEDPTRVSNSVCDMHSGEERMVDVSSGARYNMVGTAASVIQDINGASKSSCALSLLSTQSPSLSRETLGATTASPRSNKISRSNPNVGGSTGSLEKFVSSMLHPPESRSIGIDEAGSSAMISCDGHEMNFKVPGSGNLSASDFIKPKYCISSGQGMMADLLQLASRLERVEQQRTSMKLMQQNDAL